jgi:ATP-dependent Lon protease
MLTGQLGDVMKESARAALTYVLVHADRARASAPDVGDRQGRPRARARGRRAQGRPVGGVTMFTALASLLSGRQVRDDVAMTGEATLRGRVLPVGGIVSKVLAAHRHGVKR